MSTIKVKNSLKALLSVVEQVIIAGAIWLPATFAFATESNTEKFVEGELAKLTRLKSILASHGRDIIIGLIFLICGLLVVKWIGKKIRELLGLFINNRVVVSIISNVINILLLTCVVILSAIEAGFEPRPIMQLITVIILVSIGLIIFFRPYMPTLPFKVGQTVKAADLLGKVEGTTILNTRLRTFDGKTVFVPNKTILNDLVINYHYTPTRRIKLDIPIRYDQDLIKAKQVLEAVMIEDPRIRKTPRPLVWVLSLTQGGIMLAGRCWVDNLKFWTTRCDLLEKAIYRFQHEGIIISSFPHIGVHHFNSMPGIEDSEFDTTVDIVEEPEDDLEEM